MRELAAGASTTDLAVAGDRNVLTRPLGEHDGTRDRILRAAMTVVRTVGNGQFSVQKVARVAGVYQGNITYYWPRRRDLVVALAERIVTEYRAALSPVLARIDRDRADWAEMLVHWMVDDALSEDRVRLLPELWSMANADPDVAKEVTRMTEDVADTLIGALGVTVDEPGHAPLRVALMLLLMAVHGLTAAHGHRAADDPVLAEIRQGFVALHAPRLVDALAGGRDQVR